MDTTSVVNALVGTFNGAVEAPAQLIEAATSTLCIMGIGGIFWGAFHAMSTAEKILTTGGKLTAVLYALGSNPWVILPLLAFLSVVTIESAYRKVLHARISANEEADARIREALNTFNGTHAKVIQNGAMTLAERTQLISNAANVHTKVIDGVLSVAHDVAFYDTVMIEKWLPQRFVCTWLCSVKKGCYLFFSCEKNQKYVRAFLATLPMANITNGRNELISLLDSTLKKAPAMLASKEATPELAMGLSQLGEAHEMLVQQGDVLNGTINSTVTYETMNNTKTYMSTALLFVMLYVAYTYGTRKQAVRFAILVFLLFIVHQVQLDQLWSVVGTVVGIIIYGLLEYYCFDDKRKNAHKRTSGVSTESLSVYPTAHRVDGLFSVPPHGDNTDAASEDASGAVYDNPRSVSTELFSGDDPWSAPRGNDPWRDRLSDSDVTDEPWNDRPFFHGETYTTTDEYADSIMNRARAMGLQ